MRRPAPPPPAPDDRPARPLPPLLRGAAAAGVLLALGGCVVGGASDAAERGSGSAAATPTGTAADGTSGDGSECAVADLDIGMRDPSPAAGSRALLLTFTDSGTTPCTLTGHPGVAFVDGPHGDVLGRPAVPSGRSRTVTVLPGDDATAVLQLTEAEAYPAGSCDPTTAAGLRVHAPGATRSAFVRYEVQACTGSDAAPQLRVQSVGTTTP